MKKIGFFIALVCLLICKLNAFPTSKIQYNWSFPDIESFLKDAMSLDVDDPAYSKYRAEFIPYDNINGMEFHYIKDFMMTINSYAKNNESYIGQFEIGGSHYFVQGWIDRDKDKVAFLLKKVVPK